MAFDIHEEEEKDCFLRKKTEKIMKRIRFYVNEKVEVFSEEEGFQGSWHPGTVISVDRNNCRIRYHVRYDHVLTDDCSAHLVDCLQVPELVEDNNLCNNLGRIRPLRGHVQPALWNLCYGMCVDAYYNEGWWEGVVFDHENGSEKRNIFFPELGDEMMVRIDSMRITQDWNDVSGTWQNRGIWLFLELIEEYEQEHYIPVSVKQIWYDLRGKDSFKKLGKWTSNQNDLWKSLVLEVIDDNLEVFIHHLLQEISLPESYDANKHPRSNLAKNHSTRLVENRLNNSMFDLKSPNRCSDEEKSNQLASPSLNGPSRTNLLVDSSLSCHEKVAPEMPQVSSGLCFEHDETSDTTSATNENISYSSDDHDGKYSRSLSRISSWVPVGSDMVPGPEFCPDAITKYAQGGRSRGSLLVDCRKHLAYLNWQIEYLRDPMIRFRYTSPDGKQYYSLHEVCTILSEPRNRVICLHDDDEGKSPFSCTGNLLSRFTKQPTEKKDSLVSLLHDVYIEPEYCLEAAMDWCEYGHEERPRSKDKKDCVREKTMKAKKHLSALGWRFWYVNHSGRVELRYIAPSGKQYNSLRAACRDSAKSLASGGGDCTSKHPEKKSDGKKVEGGRNSSEMDFLKHKNCSTQHAYMSKFRKPRVPQKLKVGKVGKILKKRKNLFTSCLLQQEAKSVSRNFLSKMRNRRKNSSLIKLRNNRKGSRPNRVLRSSKRVQQAMVPSLSHQKPRTILSWLIDNADVLPRAKISYCSSKGEQPIAEGRINGGGSGIKCNCCGKVYALGDFEYHVTGKYDRPLGGIFSNIILEDGRSLLDCQMQLIQGHTKNFGAEPPEWLQGSSHQGDNDHICSVCHYGGELILCDQCPSSFHKSCLGMVDVPDGDWFCPSCCCKICGQNKLQRYSNHYMDNDGVLFCTQCECKYHIGCLRNRGEESLECLRKKNWFCSKKCKEIFLGLEKLLGKPIQVGSNNLTWTLLKSSQLDDHSRDVSDMEAVCGNYSQLSIALDVMHECFEPVEEPHTKRDLVKDVIFSERSKLNRLNFQGFYTVVLRKGDEFITVATVRVYGEKVAEVPLVGTRFQYRQLGMCRTLMNVLEKKLGELGVQRLVLPAVPSVLAAWTGSFGFSKLSDSERLQLLDFTFLDFQDTVMCQKLLTKLSSAESSPSREVQLRLDNDGSANGDNNDGSSTVSEVFQATQIGSEIAEYQKSEVSAMNSATGNQVVMVNPGTDMEWEQYPGDFSMESSIEESSSKKRGKEEDGNVSNSLDLKSRYDNCGEVKCYRRRSKVCF